MDDGCAKIAVYKERSTCPLPYRSGPMQCIESCTNCFTNLVSNVEMDRFRNLLCFDNLVLRKSLWMQSYQTIQFHTGQVTILKEATKAIRKKGEVISLYIISSIDHDDYKYLNWVLGYIGLPEAHLVQSLQNFSSLVLNKKTVAISIKPWYSNFYETKETTNHFNLIDFKEIMEEVFKLTKDYKVQVVAVSINKDHNKWSFYGLGSICIQISQPVLPEYYYPYYTQSTRKSDSLVQHLYHDLAQTTAMLSANIVAFLLLYLERNDGVIKSELVAFMDWLRKISIDTNMHFGFTGTSTHCVEFALIILEDYIFEDEQGRFKVKNMEKLERYSCPVVSVIAYHGLVCRAILLEYNSFNEYDPLTMFVPSRSIRVMKENVVEICCKLAPKLEQKFACRSPCISMEDAISNTITFMEKFEKSLTIEEPKILTRRERHWACESESDDEYFEASKNNPALKAWIRLTTKMNRLDRMNLLLNAVESHLFADLYT